MYTIAKYLPWRLGTVDHDGIHENCLKADLSAMQDLDSSGSNDTKKALQSWKARSVVRAEEGSLQRGQHCPCHARNGSRRLQDIEHVTAEEQTTRNVR